MTWTMNHQRLFELKQRMQNDPAQCPCRRDGCCMNWSAKPGKLPVCLFSGHVASMTDIARGVFVSENKDP